MDMPVIMACLLPVSKLIGGTCCHQSNHQEVSYRFSLVNKGNLGLINHTVMAITSTTFSTVT
jgi:hypothetical protein